MKKKISILMICLMMASVTACGKEDAKAEDVSAEVKTEVEDTEPDVAVKDTEADDNGKDVEDEKEVEVSGNLKADMTDFVLGTDIPIDDLGNFSMKVFPETHVLLPSDDVKEVTENSGPMMERLYEVTLKGGQKILVTVNMNGHDDDFCAAGHIDRLELGRYAVDYNWCSLVVEDYNERTSFSIGFSYSKYKEQLEYADEFKEFITDLTKANVDYLEEQINGWGNDFTPPASEEEVDAEPDIEENEGLLECDIVPCGTYDLDGNKYVIVSTYDDDDSGDCMLMFGCYDGTYSGGDYYDIELVENDTYSAKNSGAGISVTVTFSDGGMDLSGGTGELEGFNGHYTLQ